MKRLVIIPLLFLYLSSEGQQSPVAAASLSFSSTGPMERTTVDHKSWHNLLQKHVSPEGNVDYRGFQNDVAELDSYLSDLSSNAPTENWSKEEKLAYWINAYNAFTVKLILDNYPVASIKDISRPWDQDFFKIGGEDFDLNTIEHTILRKMDEPRIHFAIVCASASCPKLINEAYEADTLEKQLSEVTRDFLADTRRNRITPDRLELSKIFSWFDKDFKEEGTLIEFLQPYTEVKVSKKAKVSYLTYDWSLNE